MRYRISVQRTWANKFKRFDLTNLRDTFVVLQNIQ